MDYLDTKTQVTQLIQKAKNIAVVPAKFAGTDAFCAGAAMFHMLKALDKNVMFFHQGKVPEGAVETMDVADIQSDIKHKELQVSIDFAGTDASKVHYTTVDDVLHLSISPISKDYDLSKIKAKITGYDFDLVFFIGAKSYDDLGQLYVEMREDFLRSSTVNIDNSDLNGRFGTVNVIDASEDCLSLLIMNKALSWGLSLGRRAAKALLTGVSHRLV